jgi:hypothetical protein
VLGFTSRFVERPLPELPKRGSRPPSPLPRNCLKELVTLRLGPADDPAPDFPPAGSVCPHEIRGRVPQNPPAAPLSAPAGASRAGAERRAGAAGG